MDRVAEDQAAFEAEKPYDASDPKTVNDARKRAGRKKATELDVVRTIMSTPAGRAWMHALLSSCYIFGNPFVRQESDTTAFNIGQQNVGKRLLQDIMTSAPDQYVLMCRENNGYDLV